MKKRYAKKLMSATLASVMVMSMLSGCGSADSKSTEATEQTAEASTDEDIEIWSTNNGYLPVEAGSELYNFYKDIIGVGIVQPFLCLALCSVALAAATTSCTNGNKCFSDKPQTFTADLTTRLRSL